MTGGRVRIVYDAGCGFCTWAVAKILRLDRRGSLETTALQDGRAEELLRGLPPQRRMASWHVVDADGRVHSAGRAVPPLARRLRGGAVVASVAERFPGVTERIYGLIASRRHRLGRILGRRACDVHPPPNASYSPRRMKTCATSLLPCPWIRKRKSHGSV